MKQDWRSVLAVWLDQLISWIDDAGAWLPAGLRDRSSKTVSIDELGLAERCVVLRLDEDALFRTRLPISTDDYHEAVRGFSLQAERLSPLPLDAITYAVEQKQDDGSWHAVAVSNEDLARLRDDAKSAGVAIDAFEARGQGGEAIILRGEVERDRVRRRFLLTGTSLAFFALALVTASSAWSDRFDRSLASAQVHQRITRQSLRDATRQVEDLNGRQTPSGIKSRATVDVLNTLAAHKPQSWAGLNIQIAGRHVTARFELLADDVAGAQEFAQALAQTDLIESATAQSVGSFNGYSRVELNVTLAESVP
tara:strand:- start:243522 stop:244448 length:927 start_codon:yes stop_codon:yes gene_type:complete